MLYWILLSRKDGSQAGRQRTHGLAAPPSGGHKTSTPLPTAPNTRQQKHLSRDR